MEGVLPECNHAVKFVAVYDDGADSHAITHQAMIAVVTRRYHKRALFVRLLWRYFTALRGPADLPHTRLFHCFLFAPGLTFVGMEGSR
jgi:hypothetical protein